MSEQKYVLFIFEGEKTEPIIFDSFKKALTIGQTVLVSYGTVIYKLYKEFFPNDTLDLELDLVSLLKPTNEDGNVVKPSQISEIYLFFDYDGHASNACDEKLNEMIEFFDNETKKGKLFISYPMVEAIQDLEQGVDFKNTIAQSNSDYKKTVSEKTNKSIENFPKLSKENWYFIIYEHCKKANFITGNTFEFPNDIIEQNEIFNEQKEKYINKFNKKVSVLSAFPLLLLDYYGAKSLKSKLEHKTLFFV